MNIIEPFNHCAIDIVIFSHLLSANEHIHLSIKLEHVSGPLPLFLPLNIDLSIAVQIVTVVVIAPYSIAGKTATVGIILKRFSAPNSDNEYFSRLRCSIVFGTN